MTNHRVGGTQIETGVDAGALEHQLELQAHQSNERSSAPITTSDLANEMAARLLQLEQGGFWGKLD